MKKFGIGFGLMSVAGGGPPPPPVIPEFAVSSNNSSSNNYIRTASLPNKTPLTIRAWVKRESNRGNYSGYAALNKNGDELFYCGTKIDGTTLEIYFGDSGGGDGPALVDGVWNHIVYTFNGSTAKIYFNGSLFVTASATQAADAPISFTLLTTNFGSWFAGAVHGVAVWESILSDAQVLEDFNQITPQVPAWAWWLLDGPDDVTDRSGNGRTLTKVGNPIAVAGPGIPL